MKILTSLTWARAECVFGKALSVEVTGAGEKLTERYYECGIETVQQSQVAHRAVGRRTQPGIGRHGGHGPFCEGAGAAGHLDPQRYRRGATIQRESGNPERSGNALPERVARSRGANCPSGFPHDLANAWFVKLDENASRVAPQFRRMAAIPIFCTAAAAVLSGRTAYTGSSVIWLWMGTALGVMAAALPTVMRLGRRQVAWTRVRTAAEICRSCLALWRTPTLYEVVGPEVVPELAGMLTSLNFLKMSDRAARENNSRRIQAALSAESGCSIRLPIFRATPITRPRGRADIRIVTWASAILAAGSTFGCCSMRMA